VAGVCGPDHPDTAQAHDRLGCALRGVGEALESVRAHRRAVRLSEGACGAGDPRVATALTNLGLALADADRPQDAADAQSRAHAIFRSALGPGHASTLLAARRLAVALMAVGQQDRARTLLAEIIGADRPA
jgi:hypothetical protein